MERFGVMLEPHTALLSQIASTATFVRLLSPISMLSSIRKNKSSSGFPFLPFTGGLVLTLLNVKLSVVTGNEAIFRTNFIGFCLHMIYSFVYYIYTPPIEKSQLRKKLILTCLIALFGVIYCEYEDPKKVDLRMGLMLKAWLIFLVGAPFLGIGRIIRSKSVGNMPLPIVASGAAMSLSWMLYGLAIRNKFVMIPNLILFTMGFTLLSLYVIYPPRTMKPAKTKQKKKN